MDIINGRAPLSHEPTDNTASSYKPAHIHLGDFGGDWVPLRRAGNALCPNGCDMRRVPFLAGTRGFVSVGAQLVAATVTKSKLAGNFKGAHLTEANLEGWPTYKQSKTTFHPSSGRNPTNYPIFRSLGMVLDHHIPRATMHILA